MGKTLSLELSDLDYDAIQKAIAYRQTWRAMPDADGSNLPGAVMAEICRGWLEMLGRWEAGQS